MHSITAKSQREATANEFRVPPSIAGKSRWYCIALVVFAVTIFLAPSSVHGQLPVIELSAIWPTACKAGTSCEMKLASGANTDEVDQIRFSHPGITGTVLTSEPLAFNDEPEKRFGQFQVTVAADVPAGRYEVRMVGRHGVSNPRTFIVHRLDSDTQVAASHAKLAPTDVTVGSLVHGKARAAEVDYFRFDGEAGVTYRINVHAAQIDSRMIPQVDVYNEAGRLVSSLYGTDEIDPVITIPVHLAQRYTVAIYDSIYRGGEDYPYTFAICDATSAKNLDQTSTLSKRFTRLTHDIDSLIAKATKIDEMTDAKSIQVPGMYTSTFDSSMDSDVYLFSATEGEQYVIDFVSHRMGEPTDARLILERAEPQPSGDPKWQAVGNADDVKGVSDGVVGTFTCDPVLSFTAPKTTDYRLTVTDLDTGTSLAEKQNYWIDIRKPNPSVDLVFYSHFPNRDSKQVRQRGLKLLAGGTTAIRVFAVRKDGWTGPIELSVSGLPQGVTCAPAMLAANRDQTQMVLVAADDVATSLAEIKVQGKMKIDGQDVLVDAKPATTQWGRGGGRDFHRVRRAGNFVVATSAEDKSPVSFTIGDGNALEIKKGGEVKLPVKIVRQDTAKNDCTLRSRDLPPNVTAGDVKIAKDKTDGTVTLKAKANATPGTYSMWLQTETKIKIKPNPQALERAQAYRARLQKLHDDPANKDKLTEIQAAIKIADQRVEAAKGAANARDLTVFLPSPHFNIRVVE